MDRIQIDDLPVEAQLAQDEQKQLCGGATPQLAKPGYSPSFGSIVLGDQLTYTIYAGVTDGTSNTLMDF